MCLCYCVQVHTLEVFQKELNESEHLVFQAVHSLQRALQGDYRDVVNMKESSRQRLEALREAAIKVSSGQQCYMKTKSEYTRDKRFIPLIYSFNNCDTCLMIKNNYFLSVKQLNK